MPASDLAPGAPGPSLVVVVALVLVATPLLAGCSTPETPAGPTSDDGDDGPGGQAGDGQGDDPGDPAGGDEAPGGDRTREGNQTTMPQRNDTMWVGAWLGAWPNSENQALAQFNQDAGERLDVVNILLSWNTSFSSVRPTMEHVTSAGARPLLTWSPDGLNTTQIADGSTEIHLDDNQTMALDAYIESFAQGICTFSAHTGTQVLIEPMAEPNGDWHAWSIGYTGQADGQAGNASGNQTGANTSEGPMTGTDEPSQPNTNASYQEAWQHLHERFTDTCADGAVFLWTVNGVSSGPGTSYMGAYPGNETVDKVGIRGLNLGAHQPQGWSSFGGTFGHAYCNVTQATDHDVVLTSVGSVEDGGDKAQWIDETVLNASSHAWPEVKGLVWFNDEITLGDQQLDVSLGSTTEAQTAFQESMARLHNDEIPDGQPMPCPEG